MDLFLLALVLLRISDLVGLGRLIWKARIASSGQSDHDCFVKALILPAAILINLIPYTARADDVVGRFQLVPATVDSGSVLAEKMLFKIDTVTGRTCECVQIPGSANGTLVEKWIEIEQ
jgi:hypothetical protein